MRRLLAGVIAITLLACGTERILGPTNSLDGIWAGQSPGYQLTLTLTQTDSVVQGTAVLQEIAGTIYWDVNGTMVAHAVSLLATAPGFQPLNITGTLSSTQAVISSTLDGSGFNKLTMDLKKR